MKSYSMVGFLLILGVVCQPPQPTPEEAEAAKNTENAVIIFESMVAEAVVSDCVRTREIWGKLDVPTQLEITRQKNAPLSQDQQARYLNAIKAIQKVLESCRDHQECPSTPSCVGSSCNWIDCIEWSYMCTDNVESCCQAEACGG